MALIDVLMPVRHELPFIRAAIESVQAQSLRDWRLLILDHGADEASLAIISTYADSDPRIEIHDVRSAVGLSGALNAGLDLCSGRYVLRQDADDIALPERFQISVAALADNPDMIIVSGGGKIIDAQDRETGDLAVITDPAALSAACFFYNPIVHPTVAINLAGFKECGASYGRDFLGVLPPGQSLAVQGLAEDYFLFGQLAIRGRCLSVAQPLLRYRVHGGSTSSKHRVDQRATAVAISRFLAKSYCRELGVEAFDPAPFCSHGESVFNCGARDYGEAHRAMAHAIRLRFNGPGVERELAHRWVLATRSEAKMMLRYGMFAARYGMQVCECRQVRNYVFRAINHNYVAEIA